MKHASNVPGCALAIEEVFREAGFPEGLFRTLLIPGSRVDEVIENPLVRAVTLTGSTPAGKAVAAKAGEVLKKTVLELGGSDPYVILEDADWSGSLHLRHGPPHQLWPELHRRETVHRGGAVREAFEERFVAAMAEHEDG